MIEVRCINLPFKVSSFVLLNESLPTKVTKLFPFGFVIAPTSDF